MDEHAECEGNVESRTIHPAESAEKPVSLVERLDPALGEATAGIGSILTEFVRQTLRGGIQKIDDELEAKVDATVNNSVESRMPDIEAAAAATAETTARQVAVNEIEPLSKEVDALELGIQETTEQINSELEVTKQRFETTDQKIVETGELAATLARELIDDEINSLKEKSKGTASTIQAHLLKLDELASQLSHKIEDRTETYQQERSELEKLVKVLDQRIVELEKPKGIWGFFARIFGGRKKKKE